MSKIFTDDALELIKEEFKESLLFPKAFKSLGPEQKIDYIKFIIDNYEYLFNDSSKSGKIFLYFLISEYEEIFYKIADRYISEIIFEEISKEKNALVKAFMAFKTDTEKISNREEAELIKVLKPKYYRKTMALTKDSRETYKKELQRLTLDEFQELLEYNLDTNHIYMRSIMSLIIKKPVRV